MGRGSNIRSHQVAGGEEDPLGPNVTIIILNMRPSIMCVCAMILGGDQIYCNCAYEVVITM